MRVCGQTEVGRQKECGGGRGGGRERTRESERERARELESV